MAKEAGDDYQFLNASGIAGACSVHGLVARVERQSAKTAELRADLEVRSAEFDVAVRQLESVDDSRADLQERLDFVFEKAVGLSRNVSKLQAAYEGKVVELDVAEELLVSAKDEIKLLEAEQQALEAKYAGLEKEKDSVRVSYDKKNIALMAAEASVRDLNDAAVKTNATLAATHAYAQHLEKENAVLDAEKVQLEADLDAKVDDFVAVHDAFVGEARAKDALNSENVDLRNKYAALEKSCERERVVRYQLRELLLKSDAAVRELKGVVSKKIAEVNAYKKSADEAVAKTAVVTSENDVARAAIDTVFGAITELQDFFESGARDLKAKLDSYTTNTTSVHSATGGE